MALTAGMLHRRSEEEACIKYRPDSDAASYNPLGEVKAWARKTLTKISTNSTRVHTKQMLETDAPHKHFRLLSNRKKME